MSTFDLTHERTVARVPPLASMSRRVAEWLIALLLGTARPGSPGRRGLDHLLSLPVASIVAYVAFTLMMLRTVDSLAHRSPLYLLALLAIPAGWFLLRRPIALGLLLAVSSIWVRMLYLGAPETCDQMIVSRAALSVALGGGNPYGFGYAESVPPGAPFPYGPLGLLTPVLGPAGETLAFAAVAMILAWQRALFTLVFFGASLQWVELGACGMNDMIPALLVVGGLLLVERRRHVAGSVLVALSAGIKPYSFAWFPALIGYGGVTTAIALIVTAGLAWLPVLVWGPMSYLDSVKGAWVVQHRQDQNTIDMPILRVLALPLAALSLLVRSWEGMVLIGAAIFVLMMATDYWMSLGYWMVVLPPVGIVLERALRAFGASLREAAAEDRVPVAVPAVS
ncbi:MAG: hypothetical protein ABWZ82_01925 [Candidatus Limnocylindrales bacterium]